MQKIHLTSLIAALLLVVASTGIAQGQATRTWVSGVGDDVNPCSRVAPCKTFAGAISKTAAGGEINALDPAGYGTLTITKAITIDGGGTMASVLSVGATQGINVNAGANDRVILRNLTVNGAGSGNNGVAVIAANTLEVENLTLENFTQTCIVVGATTKTNVLVTRSSLTSCGTAGIYSAPTGAGSALIAVDRSAIFKSGTGIISGPNSLISVVDSVIASNGNGGVSATTATSVVNLESTAILNNTTFGVQSASSAIVRIGRSTVTGTSGTGLLASGGQILSGQNNTVAGNTPDGAATGTIAPK